MALQLKIASALEVLSGQLIEDLAGEQVGVFDKQWVVTQTDGAHIWLRQQLALQAGIAANQEFCNINDTLLRLYRWICPELPELMDKDSMTWALFAELDEAEFRNDFPAIAAYYAGDESRRAALAAEMADLFDQYQVYRHDRIAAWKRQEADETEDMSWQVYLWGRMKKRLGDAYSDRLDISQRILELLKNEEQQEMIRQRMRTLRFFGIAIVTPYFLELFRALSEIIDVTFYLLNPAPEILWMDDVSDRKVARLLKRPQLLEGRTSGNELLVNWGSVLRESYQLLLAHDEYVNRYEVLEDAGAGRRNHTLLETIQSDIYHNLPNDRRADFDLGKWNDGSVTINGCFTRVREVEVLYNYLIDLFAADSGLGAREVLVMVTDIDAYAPFIKAVFENGPIALPYSIADQSVTKANSLFTALRDILLVDTDRFKSEEVLGLLDSPFIRKRFGFGDVHSVRQAVREAGIFFGTGKTPGSDTLYDATEAWMVSWDYGLKKIIYGLCMSGEEDFGGADRPLRPLDTAEGAAMDDRISLYRFVQTLKQLLEERAEAKTISGWSDYLGKIISEMILDEEDENDDIPRLVRLRETISRLGQLSGDTPIGYHTFRQVFFSRLEQERRTNRFADKGVNFCSMLPMRSVPYKVIALLGMDFSRFPRQDSALSFSLIGKEKRAGDRSVRENDKHLFLESILAARHKLYISYLSRDVQKGAEQPPSTLVDELIEYMTAKAPDPGKYKKAAVVHHPLHVFSERYFRPEEGLPKNYLGNTLVETESSFVIDPDRTEPAPDFREVSLKELSDCYKHPIKHFFNKKFGIYYRDEEEALPETEIFELDFLERWQITDTLLKAEVDTAELTRRLKMGGKLPLANMGNITVESLEREIGEFKDLLLKLRDGLEPSTLKIRHTHDTTMVEGELQVYGDKYIYYTNSKSILRHIMVPWIHYLFALVQYPESRLNLAIVYRDKDDNPVDKIILYSADLRTYAETTVPQWIDRYKQFHIRLLYFYPPLAPLYYLQQPFGFDGGMLEEIFKEEQDSAYPKYFGKDPYLRQCIADNSEAYALFEETPVKELGENTGWLTGKLVQLFPEIFVITN